MRAGLTACRGGGSRAAVSCRAGKRPAIPYGELKKRRLTCRVTQFDLHAAAETQQGGQLRPGHLDADIALSGANKNPAVGLDGTDRAVYPCAGNRAGQFGR